MIKKLDDKHGTYFLGRTEVKLNEVIDVLNSMKQSKKLSLTNMTIKQIIENIRENIVEWDSYLPAVKRQSLDVLIENILTSYIDLLKEIVEEIDKFEIYEDESDNCRRFKTEAISIIKDKLSSKEDK